MKEQFSFDCKLYHNKVYWEDWMTEDSFNLIKSIDETSAYAIGKHVWNALKGYDERWSHKIDFVNFVRAFRKMKKQDNTEIFEVEVVNHKVTKCVARAYYDDESDISIVIRPGKICSVWKNKRTDMHFTLDTTKYEIA